MMQGPATRVGVLEFRGAGEIGPGLADELSIRLLQAGVDVIDRSELRLVLEQEGVSGFGSMDDVIAMMRNRNTVDVLVTGTMALQGDALKMMVAAGTCTVKVLDVASGKTLLVRSVRLRMRPPPGWTPPRIADVLAPLLFDAEVAGQAGRTAASECGPQRNSSRTWHENPGNVSPPSRVSSRPRTRM